ncbi:MAG: uracil-DNA glycosylase [Acidobacteriia bacterium]|nr:uracil-DNA glycosylase [Terriglobia bacterium]
MDSRLREDISAWLEFFRDLGIEEFYRREPGLQIESGKSKLETGKDSKNLVGGATTLTVPDPQTPSPESRITRAQPLSLFEAPAPPRPEREALEEIRQDLGDCQRCRLARGRKTIVFGQGNPHAELVFVGEGPGADEDEQGLPFVGRAGQLLNRMIQFVGMKREEVYICNIVKCRPPGNRTPEKDEVDACSPFLFRQIEAISPRLICCLGAPAMKTLLGIKEGITRVRGQFFDYAGTKAFVAYHPAYILRNPREEKILREDFERIREFLKSHR